jgi:hypothetical protein
MSCEGIFTGIATRSLPPMFIIRVISKNGKNIEEDDDDSNSRIVFESVEEYEEINEEILRELEPNDKIKFDLNSEGNIVNSTLRKI